MKKPVVIALLAAVVFLSAVTVFGILAVARALAPKRADRALTPTETATLQIAIQRMGDAKLTGEAAKARELEAAGLWRAATVKDGYLKQAEAQGGTPYAYTLADGRKIQAIVLAPRFFAETTETGRAALMIHEIGHVDAYQTTGKSDEYDGYKLEYDTHGKLGLGERDSLVYFSMLDGIVENVVPRNPSYKAKPDIKAFIDETSGN